jgi:hypothetical protein
MMTIPLPEDLERLVRGAVQSGRYASEEAVLRDALLRLKLAVPESAQPSDEGGAPGQEGKPLTKQEFRRHLVKIGLMDQVPDSSASAGDPDEDLIDDEGEVISEIVIRERLIAWLIGFL